MRTISEMYKLSGGTDYRNLCAECYNCIREGKSFICRLYVEAGGNRRWEPQCLQIFQCSAFAWKRGGERRGGTAAGRDTNEYI